MTTRHPFRKTKYTVARLKLYNKNSAVSIPLRRISFSLGKRQSRELLIAENDPESRCDVDGPTKKD